MAFKMKGFKPHNMYAKEKAETHKEHLALKEKGYKHSPYNKNTHTMPDGTEMAGSKHGAYKKLDHTNTECWPGKKKVGTKPSPTRSEVTVNDCK